jgi:hypothetical protein
MHTHKYTHAHTPVPGVTRDSILSLTRHWGEFAVSEKVFTMPEVDT